MSLDKNQTMILAVDAAYFRGWDPKLHLMPHEFVLADLEAAGAWIGPRGVLENRDAFLQVIPYVLIRRVVAGNEEWFTYVRGAKIAEERLRGRLTLGVGGHIDVKDVSFDRKNRLRLERTLQDSVEREVEEEVGIDLTAKIEWKGLIVDPRDAVGRVHVGVVGVLDVTHDVDSHEVDVLTRLTWMSVAELREQNQRLEGWTGLCVDQLERL